MTPPSERSGMSVKDVVALGFACVILTVWTVVAIATLITRDYTALSIVTPPLLIAAGFIFGVKIYKNGGNP